MAWFLVWHGHVLALAVPAALLVLGKAVEIILQPTEKERDVGHKPGRQVLMQRQSANQVENNKLAPLLMTMVSQPYSPCMSLNRAG